MLFSGVSQRTKATEYTLENAAELYPSLAHEWEYWEEEREKQQLENIFFHFQVFIQHIYSYLGEITYKQYY